MAATKKQFDEFAAKWAESFNIVDYKTNARAAEAWSNIHASKQDAELERQLRIIDDITVKHADTLRALADR